MSSVKKRPKVFFGWWIVTSSTLLMLYATGAVTQGFTAIFQPIVEEFGWSYAQVSLGASLRGLEVGLLAPLIGFLVDRWGSRRLVFGGVIISSSGLFTNGNKLVSKKDRFSYRGYGCRCRSGWIFCTCCYIPCR